MRAVGMPTKDILDVVGHEHRNAVYSLFRRADVPLRPAGPTERVVTSRDERRVRELQASGLAVSAIAREVGRSVAMVRRTLGADGGPTSKRPQNSARLRCAACGSDDLVAVLPGEEKE